MASEPDEAPEAEDTVVIHGEGVAGDEEPTEVEQPAAAEEEWPVAEFYRVEPEAAPADPTPAENGTIVVAQQTAAAPPRRWLIPPSVGTGLMLAIAAVVGLLILGVVLLESRNDDPDAAATTPTTTTAPETTTQDTTTTPAPSGQIALRDLEGMSLVEARAVLEEQGLRIRVGRLESDRPRGEILSQTPAAGAKLRKGDLVSVVASQGPATQPTQPATVVVPDVVGLSASDAVAAIRDAGLEARTRLVASSRPAGTVLSQSPREGSDASEGDVVVLEVAKGRPTVERVAVPDVVGTPIAAARRALRTAGLDVTVVSVDSEEAAGTIVAQSPRAGAELRKGSTVKLSVSAGPTEVAVPDVIGLDQESARLELENAGFQVRVTDESTTDPTQDGVVLRQTPPGGTTGAEGTVITLTVGRLA